MDECLRILDEWKECPADEILVQQVRLQLIVEKAALALGTWNDGAMESAEHVKMPLSFYLQALHSQLREVKNSLSLQSQRNSEVPAADYLLSSLTV